MAHVHLIAKACNISGDVGLVPEKHLNWYYTSKRYMTSPSVAHEILDHFLPDQDGSVEHELFATGSYFYQTRYGTFNKSMSSLPQSPEKIFINSIANIFTDAFSDRCHDGTIRSCPKTFKLNRIDNKLKVIVLNSWNSTENRDNLIKLFEDEEYDFITDIESYVDTLINDNAYNMLQWVAYGFHSAKRRYQKFDPWEMYLIRTTINKETAKLGGDIFEGQEFTLIYNVLHNSARIVERSQPY